MMSVRKICFLVLLICSVVIITGSLLADKLLSR